MSTRAIISKTLYELLDVKGNEEAILPFVSNYKLNLFDYHEHENFEQFHSELQSVFEFLRYSDNRKALKEKLEQKKERYENLSSQAKVPLTKIANIKKIPDITGKNFREGKFDMCKAFEDMEKKGRIEGRIEGKTEGRMEGRAQEIIELGSEVGFSETEILHKLQSKLNIPEKKAQEYFTLFRVHTA